MTHLNFPYNFQTSFKCPILKTKKNYQKNPTFSLKFLEISFMIYL